MKTALKTLQLKARNQVYTLFSGHNLSKLHGEGYDFSELRPYQIGDDIRKINWTITAKLGLPHIKEFHTNRELSIVVAACLDASLYFGEGNAKQEKLTEVATLLGYASQQKGDLFTGISYTQNNNTITPPTKQLYHIEQFSKILYGASLLHTTLDYITSMQDLFKRLHRPSLLFIIGDFLKEVDLSLLAQKHEVIVLVIRDKNEESPQRLGEVILSSPHDNTKIETCFGKKNIEKYLTKLKENDEKLIAHFSKYNIRYRKIFTDDEAIAKLLSLFV